MDRSHKPTPQKLVQRPVVSLPKPQLSPVPSPVPGAGSVTPPTFITPPSAGGSPSTAAEKEAEREAEAEALAASPVLASRTPTPAAAAAAAVAAGVVVSASSKATERVAPVPADRAPPPSADAATASEQPPRVSTLDEAATVASKPFSTDQPDSLESEPAQDAAATAQRRSSGAGSAAPVSVEESDLAVSVRLTRGSSPSVRQAVDEAMQRLDMGPPAPPPTPAATLPAPASSESLESLDRVPSRDVEPPVTTRPTALPVAPAPSASTAPAAVSPVLSPTSERVRIIQEEIIVVETRSGPSSPMASPRPPSASPVPPAATAGLGSVTD